jgi:DNA-binding IclR family transcriptional regulator
MRNTVQTVDRALQILESFEGAAEVRGVSELAGRLGVHRSTALRLVATLEARDFLERVPGSDVYRLGHRLGRLGLLASRHRDLVDAARQPMEDLAARTGETVSLAIRDADEAITIAQLDARYVVTIKNWVGRRTLLHCTSDGKVLLAFGSEHVPPGPLQRVTERTVRKRAELARQLEEVRAQGWASSIGELEEGLNGVSAPVLDGATTCRGALCVSGPSYRVSVESLPRVAEVCALAASEIGARMLAGDKGF